MGEEAIDDYQLGLLGNDDERVMEWEMGLPGAEELTSLAVALFTRKAAMSSWRS
jgi:hypothetical protein